MQQPAMPEEQSKAGGAGGSIIKGLLKAADAAQEQDNVTQENKVSETIEDQDAKHETQESKSASPPPDLADDRRLRHAPRKKIMKDQDVEYKSASSPPDLADDRDLVGARKRRKRKAEGPEHVPRREKRRWDEKEEVPEDAAAEKKEEVPEKKEEVPEKKEEVPEDAAAGRDWKGKGGWSCRKKEGWSDWKGEGWYGWSWSSKKCEKRSWWQNRSSHRWSAHNGDGLASQWSWQDGASSSSRSPPRSATADVHPLYDEKYIAARTLTSPGSPPRAMSTSARRPSRAEWIHDFDGQKRKVLLMDDDLFMYSQSEKKWTSMPLRHYPKVLCACPIF